MLTTALSTHVAVTQQTKTCTATDADKPAITETVRTAFAAATNNDLAAFQALVAPGFYAFDGGRPYEGDALMKLIIEMHNQGYKHVWSVPNPEIEVDCNTAWIAYENKGSVTTPDGVKQDRVWLESAFLVKHDRHWQLRFVHSTRAQ